MPAIMALMPQDQDASYKKLFSSPLLVRDLIKGFVPDEWLQSLDYDTLEKYPGSYIADDLRGRADDVVWRVKVGASWVYLYLLIEFQSTVDKYMALRMMVYVGLLYQDLILAGQIPKGGKLPPILPIVLYNGTRRWKAATEVSELIAVVPGLVAQYRPQMRYLLIDEGAYADAHLASQRNLVAAMFRIEHPDKPEHIRELIQLLDVWLADMPELRRTFVLWLRATLMRRSDYTIHIPLIEDLKELDMAMAPQWAKWAQDFRQEGWQEGWQGGRQEGRQEGQHSFGVQSLQKLLTKRFSPLEPGLVAQIELAPLTTLETWFERAIDAPSLAAVFADTPPDGPLLPRGKADV